MKETLLRLKNGSSIVITMDDPQVRSVSGIDLAGAICIEKDCTLNITVCALGETQGIITGDIFSVNNASVDIHISSVYDDAVSFQPSFPAWGIICRSSDIDITDRDHCVYCNAEGGIAFAAYLGDKKTADAESSEKYIPQLIILRGRTECTVPDDAYIGVCTTMTSAYETFFSQDDVRPASEIRITGTGEAGLRVWGIIAVGIALVAVMFALLKTKRLFRHKK